MFKRKTVEVIFEFVILLGAWITVAVSDSRFNLQDFEYTIESTFLTPTTNTEPMPSYTSTSKEVTLENTNQELYDQIHPSSDPTTPLSRNYLHKMWSNFQTPSTQATTINAPPPFYPKL